jgi:hypothetical protein
MADSMEAFWGRLGTFADPVNQLAEASCGCALGDEASSFELGATGASIDASAALSKVVAQYVALSTQGETLRQLMAAGVKVPCDVWLAYANARQDYMTKSQYLFDQLAAKNVTVEQVIYSGGKPKLDPNDASRVATLQVQAPLRPPAFVGVNERCPDVPVMSGVNLQGAIGWEPTPLGGSSIPSSTLVALGTAAGTGVLMLMSAGMPLGLAAYGSYKTIKQIAAFWQDYDASPSRVLAAYTGCFQAEVKAGASTADAAKHCSLIQASATQARVAVAQAQGKPSSGMGFWGWLGIGAGAFILLTVGVKLLRGSIRAAIPIPGVGESFGRSRRSRRGAPILLGDLYLHPGGR